MAMKEQIAGLKKQVYQSEQKNLRLSVVLENMLEVQKGMFEIQKGIIVSLRTLEQIRYERHTDPNKDSTGK